MPDSGLPDGVGGGPALPAYLSALLQQTADNLDRLQQVMSRGEERARRSCRAASASCNQNLAALGDRLGARAGPARADGRQPAGAAAAPGAAAATRAVLDQTTRDHIRNTDVQLGRLLEELARGRVELSRELRNEIKLVARTIAIVAGEPQVVGD